MVLEFGSDAGYSPPPPSRPTSAQRPRLRELQPLSLEPLDGADSEGEAECENGAASPTPKRGRRNGFANVSVDGEREGAHGQEFWMPGDEEAFTIYSDPKSPPRLPSASAPEELDDTMRPPESSPPPPPPTRGMRKRRSSGAIVDEEEDVAEADGGVEDGADKDRKGKRRKAAAAAAKTMTTADLRGLLPRRRRVVEHERDEFDVISTSEDAVESESDGDELARPVTRKKAAATAKAGAKGTKAKKKVARTYARAEKENDSPNRAAATAASAAAAAESSGDETVVAGGGGVEDAGRVRRSMKEVVRKFKEVDKWEMEFEDVSQGSLERGSSEGGR